jgi:hypothetical protein
MRTCDHKCNSCGEEWECDFPYYSNHHFFEEVVKQGSYCNAWCPKCDPEERQSWKELFEENDSSSYLKKTSFIT